VPSFWKAAPVALSREDKRHAVESEYRKNSRLARIRDAHHCRVCGSQFNLETHHVVPRSLVGKLLRNALSNLITVCHSCHELCTRHVVKLTPMDPERGANGKMRVTKYDAAEKGYVTVTEAA
jgi:5-methylcytosine-specific restriction endonuclease McrA